MHSTAAGMEALDTPCQAGVRAVLHQSVLGMEPVLPAGQMDFSVNASPLCTLLIVVTIFQVLSLDVVRVGSHHRRASALPI